MMRKSRTNRRTSSRAHAQPAKSQSQSGFNTPTNMTQEIINNKGQRLQTIDLSLFSFDDNSLLRESNDDIDIDTKQIGVYHGIKVSELKAMIKTVFNLPNDINIIGIKCYKNNQCLIPLSYLSNNPDLLLSNNNNDQIYQLILDGPTPITPVSRFKIIMKKIKENILLYWKIYSLIGVPSFVLIWELRLFPWTIVYYIVHLILSPLLITLYRYGPAFTIFNMQIGFWNGLPIESICAVLSGHNAMFWANNVDECNRMVNNKQNGFILLLEFIFWLYFGYQTLKLFIKYIQDNMNR